MDFCHIITGMRSGQPHTTLGLEPIKWPERGLWKLGEELLELAECFTSSTSVRRASIGVLSPGIIFRKLVLRGRVTVAVTTTRRGEQTAFLISGTYAHCIRALRFAAARKRACLCRARRFCRRAREGEIQSAVAAGQDVGFEPVVQM